MVGLASGLIENMMFPHQCGDRKQRSYGDLPVSDSYRCPQLRPVDLGLKQSWVQVLVMLGRKPPLELAFSPVLLALCGHGDVMGTTVLCSLTQAGPRSKVLIMNLLSSVPSQASGDPKALCT